MSEVRILVADDDLTTALLMQAALVRAGFAVTLAADGEEAVQAFAQAPFDMVLLDVDMPRLDGFAVCRELRRRGGEELPILMVTGMDDTASIEAAFEAGATDFISKPITWALLGHRVRYVLRATRAAAALRSANARNAAMLDALPDTLVRIDGRNQIVEVRTDPGMECCCAPSAGQALAAAYPPEVIAILERALDDTRRSGKPRTVEFQLGGAEDRPSHHEARLSSIDGSEALCLLRDITERKEYEHRIHRLAYYDSLTGLANRRGFIERLEREIARARQTGQCLAILFLTSIASRASTTPSATPPAMPCCRRQPGACATSRGRATSYPTAPSPSRAPNSPASAATSSPCCCRTSTRPRMRCRSPSASAAR